MTVEERRALGNLTELLQSIQSLDIETDLVRTERLGTDLDFSQARATFRRTKDLAEDLLSLPLEHLSDSSATSLQAALGPVVGTLEGIQSFDSGSPSPRTQRESLIEQLKSNLDSAITSAVPFLGFLSWKATNVQGTATELKRVESEARATADALVEELRHSQREAEDALAAIRDASARAGVGTFSGIFDKEAETHLKDAERWLVWSGLAAGMTLVLGIGALAFLWLEGAELTTAQSIQVGLTKAAVLGIGAYGSIAFNRNSRAHRHLAATNKHRANALAAFETFIKATDDKQVKDAVLLEATHSIFGQSPTGFLDAQAEPERVEVLRGLAGLIGSSQ